MTNRLDCQCKKGAAKHEFNIPGAYRSFSGGRRDGCQMTWTEAIEKGRDRWILWIACCAFLACCFLMKGPTSSIAFLCAAIIGAAVGAALGFGLGPAAEKGEMILSGFLAGTPFYFIGVSLLVVELQDAREWARSVRSDGLVIAGIFLSVGCLFSLAQGLRVRKQVRHRAQMSAEKN
jgi:FtsH-binding integral membrane protein